MSQTCQTASITETLFEKYDLERLGALSTDTAATLLHAAILNGVNEVPGEVATELANFAADYLVMGNLSQYQREVAAFAARGQSEEAARRLAAENLGRRLGMTALKAYASGALLGGMAYGTHPNTASETAWFDGARMHPAVAALTDPKWQGLTGPAGNIGVQPDAHPGSAPTAQNPVLTNPVQASPAQIIPLQKAPAQSPYAMTSNPDAESIAAQTGPLSPALPTNRTQQNILLQTQNQQTDVRQSTVQSDQAMLSDQNNFIDTNNFSDPSEQITPRGQRTTVPTKPTEDTPHATVFDERGTLFPKRNISNY